MSTDTEPTARASGRARGRRSLGLCVLFLLAAVATALPAGALAEQASQPPSLAAGQLDSGGFHTCALVASANVRCWGFNGDGQLGYGNRNTIGDDETPGSVGTVDVGAGRTAVAIGAGEVHTCALLDNGRVRCWGYGFDGRLGYGFTANYGDDETPGSVGTVDLGTDRTAKAITAGGAHTCALLDTNAVRCWGFGATGRLGDGTDNLTDNRPPNNIGDDETPGSLATVDLGADRTAKAITAGGGHTCALLDNDTVRCWGYSGADFTNDGRLGYGNTNTIGDDEKPGSVGPVALGRPAKAITAGDSHTCALLDNDTVRCWGYGLYGRLGYANESNIGDDETPGLAGPVELGRPAKAISAGGTHTCALLDNDTVRCWGYGFVGRLGYANERSIGDDETPASVGPVDLGGRTAIAISAARNHVCARQDDGTVRCWGFGGNGRLGYCNLSNVGDDETPGSVGPVNLDTPGTGCASTGGSGTGTAPGGAPPTDGAQPGGGVPVSPVAGLQTASQRGPGPVLGLRARAASKSRIVLRFRAAGTNGTAPPPARSYLIRQSRRPIRNARDFRGAQTLCKGSCRFAVPRVGTKVILRVTDLRPRTTYYYAVAARDNVSRKLGPRSKTVMAKTR